MLGYYWRITDLPHTMSLAHGHSASREGVTAQVAAFLNNAPEKNILASIDGYGMELIIQPLPTSRDLVEKEYFLPLRSHGQIGETNAT